MSGDKKLMETVRLLLARAEHPNTPPEEADTALRRANALMARHAIDEALVRATQTARERRAPVVEKWNWASAHTGYGAHLRSMLEAIARYNRVRVHIELYAPYGVTVVGFREDVDWVQMLYTNCYLTFMGRVNPKWDPEASLDANIYTYKIAGYGWFEIWVKMVEAMGLSDVVEWRWPNWKRDADNVRAYPEYVERYKAAGIPCGPPVTVPDASARADNNWMLRAYRRHAKKIGDTQIVSTQRLKAYKLSFAQGFADEIERRLARMDAESREAVGSAPGAELALRDAWVDIEEAFYAEYPDSHPDAIRERNVIRHRDAQAALEQERILRENMLNAMTETQRADFLEKEARKARRERQSNQRYWEDYDRRNRADSSGLRAGRAAAADVALSRGTAVRADSGRKAVGR